MKRKGVEKHRLAAKIRVFAYEDNSYPFFMVAILGGSVDAADRIRIAVTNSRRLPQKIYTQTDTSLRCDISLMVFGECGKQPATMAVRATRFFT